MKQSLSELFGVPIATVQEHFNIVPQLQWAICNLECQIAMNLRNPEWMSLENAAKRRYLEKARTHYQGNLDELLSGTNTAVAKAKGEAHYDNSPTANA